VEKSNTRSLVAYKTGSVEMTDEIMGVRAQIPLILEKIVL